MYISFSILGASAQTETDSIAKVIENNDIKLSALPYYSYGKGLGLTSADSLFQFNIRFRMQNRATASFSDEEESEFSAQVRRLRLRFDGFVGDPKFSYVIQLSFAAGDVGVIQEGQNINVIRDAIVFTDPIETGTLVLVKQNFPGTDNVSTPPGRFNLQTEPSTMPGLTSTGTLVYKFII